MLRQRVDVRIGSNRVKKGSTPSECDFQILTARPLPTLTAPWGTADRPCVTRILQQTSDHDGGHILPIRSPAEDLEETPMGVKFKHASIVPQFVMFICVASDEPEVTRDEGTGLCTVRHVKVLPGPGSDVAGAFEVEGVCTLSETCFYNMADGGPRLVVGTAATPTKIVAERIFKLREDPGVAAQFHTEREACWDLLGRHVERIDAKRPGSALMDMTPSKKACPSWSRAPTQG